MAHKRGSSHTRQKNTTGNNTRFLDIPTEINNDLNPIDGYQNGNSQSLSEAVEPIKHLLTDVKRNAENASNSFRGSDLSYLSIHQAAAIKLYTMEWSTREKCLFFVLNETLRNRDRKKLIPWFPYLKLLLTGLFKLDSAVTIVYRGVKLDLLDQYPVNKIIIWWALSSCTTDLKTLDSNEFLGQSGTRTMFIINCHTGRDISKYSSYSREHEILLLPATKFIVKCSSNPAPGLYIIELQEIPSSNILLEIPDTDFDIPANSQIDRMFSEHVRSTLDLSEKQLDDRDIAAVCKNLISDTSRISLDLSFNNITLDGADYIRKFLQNNHILKTLNLSNNQLTDFGIMKVVHGLESNRTLESINLRSNQITDNGVELLVTMFDHNQTIVDMDLGFNEITDNGICLLTDLLKKQNQLQKLFLNANKATDYVVENIENMLNINRSLTCLYLDENQLSQYGKNRIRLSTLSKTNFVLSL